MCLPSIFRCICLEMKNLKNPQGFSRFCARAISDKHYLRAKPRFRDLPPLPDILRAL